MLCTSNVGWGDWEITTRNSNSLCFTTSHCNPLVSWTWFEGDTVNQTLVGVCGLGSLCDQAFFTTTFGWLFADYGSNDFDFEGEELDSGFYRAALNSQNDQDKAQHMSRVSSLSFSWSAVISFNCLKTPDKSVFCDPAVANNRAKWDIINRSLWLSLYRYLKSLLEASFRRGRCWIFMHKRFL